MDATTRYVPLEAACKTLEQRLGRLVSVEDVLRHAADNTIMLYWDISSLKLTGVRHTVPEDLDVIDVNDDDDAVVKVPRDIYEIHFDGFGTPDYFLALADGDTSQWPSRSPVIVAPTAPGFHWELRERNPAIPLSNHSDDDYLPGSRVPRIAELRVDLEMLDEFDDMETVDGVTSQDLADMVEFQNNEQCIDWEFWVAKMPVWTAAQAVRLMAALDPELFPDLSTQRNDSAGAAKELARRLERLTVAHRMSEKTPTEWLKWADDLREPVHLGLRIALDALKQGAASRADSDTKEAPPIEAAVINDHTTKRKLTADDVEIIRAEAAKGTTHQTLAERYGVTRQYVSKVCSDTKPKAKKARSPFDI